MKCLWLTEGLIIFRMCSQGLVRIIYGVIERMTTTNVGSSCEESE